MNAIRFRKRLITVFLTIIILLGFTYIRTIYMLPENLMIMEGKEYSYEFNTPISVGLSTDQKDVLNVNGTQIKNEDYKISLNSPVKLKSNKTGKVSLNLKLFGKIPVKTVTVNVVPETSVIPCGNTVGVKMFTKGVLVIGTSAVAGVDGKEYKPYKEAEIEEGDIIISMDGNKIKGIMDISEFVSKSSGKKIELEVLREEKTIKTEITPIKAIEDKKYKLGLWVRDSTAGIGTLTFYDPKTQGFAALGHGITDIDTGSILNVEKGDILESSIISVKKGKKGDPGELKGIFLDEEFKRGNIVENNEYGIYGKLTEKDSVPNNAVIPVALRSEVNEGPAVILSNVDGRKVESFAIEIQKVMRSNYNSSKSMVIKITDPKLIDKTGGIVQGMSGSPIIQNGKLVGAVTHVFVNDPTRGYGIFSELMIQKSNSIK